jgi:hypothetical protein
MLTLPSWTKNAIEVRLQMPLDDVRELARMREEAHLGQSSSAPMSVDYELVGLVPEIVFGEVLGLPLDLEIRPLGDGGADYTTPGGTVDVKGAQKPYNILRPIGTKNPADIIVLAGWVAEIPDAAFFLGWEYDAIVVQQSPERWPEYVINHIYPSRKLRPMSAIREVLRIGEEA